MMMMMTTTTTTTTMMMMMMMMMMLMMMIITVNPQTARISPVKTTNNHFFNRCMFSLQICSGVKIFQI